MIITDRGYQRNPFQEETKRLLSSFKDDVGKKYKTEICKNWQAGVCKFGPNCIFAHGKPELRENSIKKNINCNNFSNNFYCPYGEKCQFMHCQVAPKRLPIFVCLQRVSED